MIEVGIIGASVGAGWASRAHFPALNALDDYEITAVGTSRPASAREAAAHHGAAHAFTDATELAAHPDVDLVVVTVKVPAHAALVRAAIGAGKHVLSEWPLGLGLAEASALHTEADRAGIRHAIGLQARHSPAARRARELIDDGHLGRVTSITAHVTRGKGTGATTPAHNAYTFDRANGAGLVEVAGGHTLDLVEYLTGEITEVAAATAVQQDRLTVTETGETITATAPDHLMLHGTMATGASLSAHLQDAKLAEPHARLEISGTTRDLLLTTVPHGDMLAAQVQIGELALYEVDAPGKPWTPVAVPADTALPEQARNVAALYRALAADLRDGGRRVAGFAEAERAHRVLDAVTRAAETGTRVAVG
ncbi:Gfo/Idh/MocA family protein [Phytomonospora endophytica]|uniref:Putative dehydrogenase n=1 Tax=Phytomonospora endophytica TaxID=714109 RepID=A0A841FRR8_9ACTN|nr:Gfo/Idh/MocA family oxidoreductase [Phytomonospora endophytica]MBB6038746.1 putative dehydrogenase [Phytomonospora endophytica]GIG68458.1 oxidoreductase [Phytomonospora endophytica]